MVMNLPVSQRTRTSRLSDITGFSTRTVLHGANNKTYTDSQLFVLYDQENSTQNQVWRNEQPVVCLLKAEFLCERQQGMGAPRWPLVQKHSHAMFIFENYAMFLNHKCNSENDSHLRYCVV
jgi:hypothetical protein